MALVRDGYDLILSDIDLVQRRAQRPRLSCKRIVRTRPAMRTVAASNQSFCRTAMRVGAFGITTRPGALLHLVIEAFEKGS